MSKKQASRNKSIGIIMFRLACFLDNYKERTRQIRNLPQLPSRNHSNKLESCQRVSNNGLESCHSFPATTTAKVGARRSRGAKPPSERSERRTHRNQQRTRILPELPSKKEMRGSSATEQLHWINIRKSLK